jgi:hypothetical protein
MPSPPHDLHVSKRLQTRLKANLPPHTAEEKQQLADNLIADGIKLKPIVIWNDGEKFVIVDGNTSWPIIQKHNIPYTTHEMHFADYDEAERWALSHAIGTRTSLSAQSIKLLIGALYNKTKKAAGRPVDSEICENPAENDENNVADSATLSPASTAETIATTTGVSPRTVRADAKFAAMVEELHPALKAQIVAGKKITNPELKRALTLSVDKQMEVSRALQTGQAADVKAAFKQCCVAMKPTLQEELASTLDDDPPEPEPDPTPEDIVKEHNKQIESFCQRVKKIADECPDLFWLTDGDRKPFFLTKLKNGVETLRAGKCVVCPACNGEGCKACKKQGHAPKQHLSSQGLV